MRKHQCDWQAGGRARTWREAVQQFEDDANQHLMR